MRLAPEALCHIPTDRIRRIIDLRTKFEVGPQARLFRQCEDLDAMRITELPDNQLREMPSTSHANRQRTVSAHAKSTSCEESTQ